MTPHAVKPENFAAQSPPAPTNSPALIESDIPCLGCGYNLRGLDPAGRCPECGGEIDRSIHGDALRYANSQWTRRLEFGLRLAWSGVLVGVVSVLVAVIALVAASAAGVGVWFEHVLTVLAGLLVGGGVVAYAVGLWLFTTPDPAESQAAAQWRQTLRWSFVGLPLLVAVSPTGGRAWPALSAVMTTLPLAVEEMIRHATFAVTCLHLYALVRQLEAVDRRCRQLPDGLLDQRHRLRSHRRAVVWCPILVVLSHWYTLVGAPGIPPTIPPVPTYLSMRPGGAGVLVMVLLWVTIASQAMNVARRIAWERVLAGEFAQRRDRSESGVIAAAVPGGSPGAN